MSESAAVLQVWNDWTNADGIRRVIVEFDNDPNPRGSLPWKAPTCPHCGDVMAMHRPGFNTLEPPSWMCRTHGNEGVVFLFATNPPLPKGALGIPFIEVYCVPVEAMSRG